MTTYRLPNRGRVDHGKPVTFTVDGKSYKGLAGDTLASALLANGVHLMGRSFKYHRPRGVVSAGSDEPNALFGTRLTDVLAGFRALRRDAVDLGRLRAARYDIEVDLIANVLRGGVIVEVPVSRYPRRHGHSHLHAVRDGTRILLRMIHARIS